MEDHPATTSVPGQVTGTSVASSVARLPGWAPLYLAGTDYFLEFLAAGSEPITFVSGLLGKW